MQKMWCVDSSVVAGSVVNRANFSSFLGRRSRWKRSETIMVVCSNYDDFTLLRLCSTDIMGAVRITSLNPKFNGSHFGLPPSSIHRMTGWVAFSRILWRMRTAPIQILQIMHIFFCHAVWSSKQIDSKMRVKNWGSFIQLRNAEMSKN